MILTPAAIKARARDIGFDLCGISPVDDFSELTFLREWLDRGYAGDMSWMTRTADRRADVRQVLPGVRSVIATATLYNTNRPYSQDRTANEAVLSRYAWGDDYHDVLKQRLQSLVAWMRAESDQAFEALVYVDTGPVQERVYAQYAGLGWIGKNSCLINAELGSWIFLAEILCTLPLEPDTQGLEQCGSCTRCLEACPTGALVEPGVLDSTRCLSYLTIELRGGIPEPLREPLGNQVYGCDICQEVCPYNRPASASTNPAWQPRPALDLPSLVEMWRRPDAELRRATKGSAMSRAKVTGLRRNLAVAIGNSGDAAAIAALGEAAVESPSRDDEMVREHVAWAQQRVSRVPAQPE